MIEYIGQNGQKGQKGFVPLVPCEANVMGIQRTLYHAIDEFAYQMALRRGFLQVLREEHSALTKQNVPDIDRSMEEAQYFTMEALVKVYPVLEYLTKYDNQMSIGKRCVTVGTVQKPMYLVKVGEATSKDDARWKCGIYRIAPVMLPGENAG